MKRKTESRGGTADVKMPEHKELKRKKKVHAILPKLDKF